MTDRVVYRGMLKESFSILEVVVRLALDGDIGQGNRYNGFKVSRVFIRVANINEPTDVWLVDGSCLMIYGSSFLVLIRNVDSLLVKKDGIPR